MLRTTYGVFELLLAMVFELVRAEPPEKIHPTVWFGRIVGFLDNVLPGSVLSGLIPPVLTVSAAILLAGTAQFIQEPFRTLFSAYLLYSSISVRSMVEHALACIQDGRPKAGMVGRIVSRDVYSLEDWQLNSAVIESVAENFVDGVLAPLLYYSVFGVYGALVYRAVNTCDAMLGYRKGKYERFGKISARFDDILNFVPSRLSLLLFTVLSRKSLLCGLKFNPKLNGHAIPAMAGLLGVKLEKPGSYSINCGKEPDANDVVRAVHYFKVLSGMTVILALISEMLV